VLVFVIFLVAVGVSLGAGLLAGGAPPPRAASCADCGGRAVTFALGADLCGACAVERDRKAWP
jgi:hypothetical protein